MKNGNLIVNIIFAVAIIVLFVLYAKKPNQPTETTQSADTIAIAEQNIISEDTTKSNFPIAYVIVDSVMHNYFYYQKLEKDYQKLVNNEEARLQKKADQFQKEVEDFQYQIEKRIITSADAQAKEAELTQKQQNLYAEQQKRQQELAQKEQKLLDQLIDSVYACIKDYNADGKYKIILNNAYQSSVLYAEEQLNITNDILLVMNKRYQDSQATKK